MKRTSGLAALGATLLWLPVSTSWAQAVRRDSHDAGVSLDADAPNDAEVRAALAARRGEPALPSGVGPITWAETRRGDCHGSARARICEGPRRVPLPRLDVLDRQRALDIDSVRAAHRISGTVPEEWVAAIPEGPMPENLSWPVAGGRLWRGFGMHARIARARSGGIRRLRTMRKHEGVDIGADDGTPILAVNDGLVIYSDNGLSGYGNTVILVHRDGSTSQYSHCQATFVAAGEIVSRGQIIAAVGDTGLAHGAHLHFEWRVRGRTVDPLRHFVNRPHPASQASDDEQGGELEADPVEELERIENPS